MPNNILSPFQLLELNVISAQDLAIVSRKMRTYAIAWVHPDRKLSTRVDIQGHNNPTWNDKFVFRVDEEFLQGETSAVMIEIYALHWFRDIHVGTVRILVGNLIPPAARQNNKHTAKAGTRFVALQARRASGRPQGILNIGVATLNSSMRSMPLYTQLSASAVGFHDLVGEKSPAKNELESTSDNNNQYLLPWYPKRELRRVKSDSSSLVKPVRAKVRKSKASSMVSGSEIVRTRRNTKKPKSNSQVSSSGNRKSNSVITDSTVSYRQRGTLTLPRKSGSEIGPSVSEVAANSKTNKKKQNEASEKDSEYLMEEWSLEDDSMEGLESKLERWRSELPPAFDRSELDGPNSSMVNFDRGHLRRGSHDGKAFSCFGNICGLEISMACGGGGGEASRRNRKIKRSQSVDESTFV